MKFYNLLLKKSGTHTVFLIIPNAVTRTIKNKLNVMLSCCLPCLPLSCTDDIVVFFFSLFSYFVRIICLCVCVCVCVCVYVCDKKVCFFPPPLFAIEKYFFHN